MTAYRTKWTVGLCVALASLASAQATELTEETLRQPLPIKVEFTTESDSLSIAASQCFPVFRVTVTNASDHPIRIPTNLMRFGFPHSVRPNGERSEYGTSVRVEFTGTCEETVLLPPGAWFGTTVSHCICLDELGDWTVWWELCVPYGSDEVSMEPGRASSEPILVTVTP